MSHSQRKSQAYNMAATDFEKRQKRVYDRKGRRTARHQLRTHLYEGSLFNSVEVYALQSAVQKVKERLQVNRR